MMEVKFHLPGLRYNYPLNMFFVGLQSLHPEYFREGVKIASFFGEFPTSLWSGGRFCNDDQCDAVFVREVIKNINPIVPKNTFGLYSLNNLPIVFNTLNPSEKVFSFDSLPAGLSR